MWCFSCIILLLNTFTLVFHAKQTNINSESVLLISLSVSDIMCGLYLVIILSADVYYKGEYILFSNRWQHSVICKMVAIISSVYYASSPFCLSIIAFIRYLTITSLSRHPWLEYNRTFPIMSMWFVIIISSSLSVILKEKPGSNMDNMLGDLCIDLVFKSQTIHDTLVALIFTFNSFSVIFILICYIAINKSVKETQGNIEKFISKQGHGQGQKITVFAFLVTFSNIVYWLPLCIVNLLIIVGHKMPSLVIITIVGVTMSLNALLNPWLYTLTTHNFKQQYISKCREIIT